MYHDCNSLPWAIDKRWEDLNPKEWVEVCSFLILLVEYCKLSEVDLHDVFLHVDI